MNNFKNIINDVRKTVQRMPAFWVHIWARCSVIKTVQSGSHMPGTWTYEGYLESNLQWAVNKTSNKKKCYCIQKICTYLNYFSMEPLPESRNLSYQGISFLCLCQRVCCLWAQSYFDICHQLLIIVEALWLQPVEVVRSCKKGGRTTPRWNAPAVLECEQQYVDAYSHAAALYQMSFHVFCSERPYSFLVFCNTLLTLWSLVA
jgi:hypothetical protein